jgi:hypothetical protein
MGAVVERNNLRKALEQVQCNGGAPGVGGMSVNKLASHLKEHWPAIRAQLLKGAYEPQPVRRVEITPMTIELAFAALTNLEGRDRAIGTKWRMRIERARYDVDLAERRYEAVDPENRLIAATLDTRWDEAT